MNTILAVLLNINRSNFDKPCKGIDIFEINSIIDWYLIRIKLRLPSDVLL